MNHGLRWSASGSGQEKIRGLHRGVEVEWSQARFAELIRSPVEHALDLGLSAEEAWKRARSMYRVAAAFEDRARGIFEAVVREQKNRSPEGSERRKERR
jgi:hypothetical protein